MHYTSKKDADRSAGQRSKNKLSGSKFTGDWLESRAGRILRLVLKYLVIAGVVVGAYYFYNANPVRFFTFVGIIIISSIISDRMGLGLNPFTNFVAGGDRFRFKD